MGQSEQFYAWVVAGFHIGAVTGSLVAAPLLKVLPYRYCVLLSLSLGGLGYLLYALGNPSLAWFTLIGRLLAGLSFGCCISLQLAYLGETGTEEQPGGQQQNTKPRKTLKDKLFLIYTFANTSSYMFAPGTFVQEIISCLACGNTSLVPRLPPVHVPETLHKIL